MIIAKKSLGQNFLIDQEILELIVNLTAIEGKSVLEIGPGTGNLTSLILEKKPKEFCVIEKDNDLAKKLTNNFKISWSIKKFCPKLFLAFINFYPKIELPGSSLVD